jgi:peptide deformylase
MAVIHIRTLPDPVLKQKAKKVPGIDPSIRKLIDNMIETMYEYNGIGLAAPQVGVSLRIAVIRMPEEGAEEIILINPEIIKKTGEREIEERCLSIPGYAGTVKRALTVTVKARDENYKEIRLKGDGLLAQALEHEIEHLQGILYVDRLVSPDTLIKVPPVETESEK